VGEKQQVRRGWKATSKKWIEKQKVRRGWKSNKQGVD
jgi:hypothetical protein